MSHIFISANAPSELISLLKNKGHTVYALTGKDVSSPVSCHADMFITGLGRHLIWARSGELSPGYPHETAFNALFIGNRLFCRAASASPRLLKTADEFGISVINVNQGYAACSVCIVNECAAITADVGMAAAMEGAGIDVLLIRQNGIRLPGYNEGFIGGASGSADGELFFFGDITAHPDWTDISIFLAKHGKSFTFCPEMPLLDLGGMFESEFVPDFDETASFALTKVL